MNQEKTGSFIAELRKEKGLTQAQLAERFGLSNKTVSKWEILPDASIMIDLCDFLGITVNELLSGERIRVEDYMEKAEETIASVVRISQEEKVAALKEIRNRGLYSIVIGMILFVAAIYASYVLNEHRIYGLPQAATMGMLGFIGLIISNGMVSMWKSNRLLKEFKNK